MKVIALVICVFVLLLSLNRFINWMSTVDDEDEMYRLRHPRRDDPKGCCGRHLYGGATECKCRPRLVPVQQEMFNHKEMTPEEVMEMEVLKRCNAVKEDKDIDNK